MSEAKPFSIDRFLGVNESATETLLQLGEAASMSNFIITDDQKLSKQYGYIHKINLGPGNINGFINFNGKVLVAHDTNLYEFEESEL